MADFFLTVPGQSGREGLKEYLGHGGYGCLGGLSPEEIVVAVDDAGLRGRGGSGRGTPVAAKWREVMGSRRGQRYVVANGAESSPGSRKDRYLMEVYPHRVLDGALAAARAVGAALLYLYVKATAEEARLSLEEALEELAGSGLLPPDSPSIQIFRAPDSQVAGEETAVCDSIHGFTGQPQVKPPYPATDGLFGRPTLIANVETLAAAAAILRVGPERFRSTGLPDAPGTILVTIGGDVKSPGVYEVPLGTPIRRVIEEHGGGPTGSIQAVLPGGFRSGPLTPEELDLPLDYDSLLEAGTTLGAAHLVVLASPNRFVDLMQGALELAVTGSCRQCAICGEGTIALNRIAADIATGAPPAPLLEEIGFLTQLYHGKGNCGFLTGAAMLARRAAERFPNWTEEVAIHGRDH